MNDTVTSTAMKAVGFDDAKFAKFVEATAAKMLKASARRGEAIDEQTARKNATDVCEMYRHQFRVWK